MAVALALLIGLAALTLAAVAMLPALRPAPEPLSAPSEALVVPTRPPTPVRAGSRGSAARPAPTVMLPIERRPTATTPPASQSGLTEQEAIARVLPAVIRVATRGGVGTGVILRADGVAVTAAHVVGEATTAEIRLHDGTAMLAAVERTDVWSDLALLRLPRSDLPAARLGDASTLQVGEPLIAIGYALDLPGSPTVTRGLFSARRLGKRGVEYLQTDAALNAGNSGGPLVSLRAEVVGINDFVIRQEEGVPVEGVNFAISSAVVRTFLEGQGTDRRSDAGLAQAPISTPSPATSPEETVRIYYRAIGNRDYRTAYELMGSTITRATDYNAFTRWFSNKYAIVLRSVTLVSRSSGEAVVEALVTSRDRMGEAEQLADYVDRWSLDLEAGAWRMSHVETTLASGVSTGLAAELRAAVLEYDRLEQQAWATENAELVRPRATSGQVAELRRSINARRSQGERVEPRLEAIIFRGFRQPTTDRVEVDAIEFWSRKVYDRRGKLLREEPVEQLPQTTTWLQIDGRWLLEKAHFYPVGSAPF